MRIDPTNEFPAGGDGHSIFDAPLILVVEPDPKLRSQVCLALEGDESDVIELQDGPALLEFFQNAAHDPMFTPNVIVADVSRPEARVLEACEQIHQTGATVPMVLLSPHRQPEIYEACERAGAIFIFDQPLDLERLRSAVWGLSLRS